VDEEVERAGGCWLRSNALIFIETREAGNTVTFRVQGRLAGAGVATLEECWRTARRYPRGKFAVDLTAVTYIDQAGSVLLQLMDRERVAFVTTGLMTEQVNEMLGRNKKQGETEGEWKS
jgi:ABC-type transporter Mla MlaB component